MQQLACFSATATVNVTDVSHITSSTFPGLGCNSSLCMYSSLNKIECNQSETHTTDRLEAIEQNAKDQV